MNKWIYKPTMAQPGQVGLSLGIRYRVVAESLKTLIAQSCLTLCDHMDYSPPGSSVQARILEWVAIPFSKGSSQLRDRTHVSWITGRSFTIWAPREVEYHFCHLWNDGRRGSMWGITGTSYFKGTFLFKFKAKLLQQRDPQGRSDLRNMGIYYLSK